MHGLMREGRREAVLYATYFFSNAYGQFLGRDFNPLACCCYCERLTLYLPMGHLEDARMLSQRYGLNPDSWIDVQKVMPKLRNPSVAKTLKHGYARGGEAVVFVETVRLYHDMLNRISHNEYKQLLPPDYQIKLNAW